MKARVKGQQQLPVLHDVFPKEIIQLIIIGKIDKFARFLEFKRIRSINYITGESASEKLV